MPDGTTSEHDLLDRAARLLAQTGLPVQPSGGPRALLAHYYRHVPPEDLQGRDAAAVAGAVAA
ncbi:MAG: hypothetical protein JWN57_2900, partial [Frankiales bacterium]|nr:hypothetical protein [Frankiales bacterium]